MAEERGSRGLAEQLAPLIREIRQRTAVIQPVSQVLLRVNAKAGTDRFADCVRQVLPWLSNRSGRPLPPAAWNLESFELSDVGAQPTAAVSLAVPRFWAARLDDADRAVPQRTWTTEIALGLQPDGDVLFGTRLVCASRGEASEFERTVPGFVKAIAQLGAELDGRPIAAGAPTLISREVDVDDLVDLLEDPARRCPAVVVALPEGSTDSAQAVIDAGELSRKVLGAAHVFVITGPATFHLTDRMGREMSVFRAAVRLYRPGFNRGRDQPVRHPLFLPERVRGWGDDGATGFARYLRDQVLATSVRGSHREDDLPAFRTVRQMAAQRERDEARQRGGSADEMLDLYKDDNERLQRELVEQLEYYDSEVKRAQSEREQAQQEAQEARGQLLALRERVRALEKAVKGGTAQAQATPIPEQFDDLSTWAQEYLSGFVVVHNRAAQGAKKSEFTDPPLAYKALLLLRDLYVPMRVEGGKERKEAFEAAARELGLENSPVGEAVKQYPAEYTVNFGGLPRTIDWHLKKGDSREPRHCFRLYYFWDEDSQCVVVGWLTSHLRNSLS
jgi:hypothetical protein